MAMLGAIQLPLGFGFHPTDGELIYYLKKKLRGQEIEFGLIPEVDIYKIEPWDLPANCDFHSRDGKWHLFTPLDPKYSTGSRSNRTTSAGYWKSTGRDRKIKDHCRVVGTKKTLVFHEGRPPSGKRTDWIMHEYSADEPECNTATETRDVYVLCRVTKRGGLPLEANKSCTTGEQVGGGTNIVVTLAESSGQSEPDLVDLMIQELFDPSFSIYPACDNQKDGEEHVGFFPAAKLEPFDDLSSHMDALEADEDLQCFFSGDHDSVLDSGDLFSRITGASLPELASVDHLPLVPDVDQSFIELRTPNRKPTEVDPSQARRSRLQVKISKMTTCETESGNHVEQLAAIPSHSLIGSCIVESEEYVSDYPVRYHDQTGISSDRGVLGNLLMLTRRFAASTPLLGLLMAGVVGATVALLISFAAQWK